jgi:hypothetical protein
MVVESYASLHNNKTFWLSMAASTATGKVYYATLVSYASKIFMESTTDVLKRKKWNKKYRKWVRDGDKDGKA